MFIINSPLYQAILATRDLIPPLTCRCCSIATVGIAGVAGLLKLANNAFNSYEQSYTQMCHFEFKRFFKLDDKSNNKFSNLVEVFEAFNLPNPCSYDQKTDTVRGKSDLDVQLFKTTPLIGAYPVDNKRPGDARYNRLYGLTELLCTHENDTLRQCSLIKGLGKKNFNPQPTALTYSVACKNECCNESIKYNSRTISNPCFSDPSLLECFSKSLSEQDCLKSILVQPNLNAKIDSPPPLPSSSSSSSSSSSPSMLRIATSMTAVSGAVFLTYKTVMEIDQLVNPFRLQYRNKQEASALRATAYGVGAIACTFFTYKIL